MIKVIHDYNKLNIIQEYVEKWLATLFRDEAAIENRLSKITQSLLISAYS